MLGRSKKYHISFALFFLIYTTSCIKYAANGTIPPVSILADKNNNRLLIWKSTITSSQQPPDLVLGQPDFNSNSVDEGLGAPTAYTVSPQSIFFDGKILYSTDQGRVLVWNNLPTINNQPADLELGQPGFLTSANNNPNTTLGMANPIAITSDSKYLYLADRSDNRILIWNLPIVQNQQQANFVLGQSTLAAIGANQGGGVTSKSLWAPSGIAVDNQRLYVSDAGNNRVLIYNLPVTANNQAANVVLGQPNMNCNVADVATGSCVAGALSSQNLSSPIHVAVLGNRLAVADRFNNRVLIWNSIPTINQQSADVVLGQSSMATAGASAGSQGLSQPWGIFMDLNHIFVGDTFNNRVLVWNSFPIQNGQAADLVFGQPDMNQFAADNGGNPACSQCSWAAFGIYTNGSVPGVFLPQGY